MSFHLKLVVPSHPRFLSIVRAAVGEISMVYGLSEESTSGVVLAVDEALANVIRHAYEGNYDREIEFYCRVIGDKMEFIFLDCGVSPDPDRICGQPLNDVSLSGRGTHLIKAIMDEVYYEQVAEGNQLRLIKHLPAAGVNVEGEQSTK